MAAGVAWEFVRAATGVGGARLEAFSSQWVYTAVEAIAVLVCATRVAVRKQDRPAWLCMTLGLATWSVGDLLWTVWLDYVPNPPFPSIADAAYLLMYPAMYVALMLLIRSRLRHTGIAEWLDGGVVALTIGSVAAALVFSIVLATTHGELIDELVNVSYPVGDFMLLMFVACAFSLANWRPGWGWLLIGLGLIATAVADLMYVYAVAKGSPVTSDLLNGLYLLSMSLLAIAAWAPDRRQTVRVREAPQTVVLTSLAAAGALALLVTAAFQRLNALAVGLAAAALVLAGVRAALTYLENVRAIRRSGREAVTDALSGLGNRRALMADLADALRDADHRESTLVFLDLNGFKRYNDTFGHAAGDALLTRLGESLGATVGDRGHAYRVGGDEFCALLNGNVGPDDALLHELLAALSERGGGFEVDASFGLAAIPHDASTITAVMTLADERMYASKARVGRVQARDVLWQLLSERTPDLANRSKTIARVARAVASELRLDAEQLDELVRAAELHDVGKLAIPDEILLARRPLDARERAFVRQHPAIGERILGAASSLAPVARIVRASHERWDGTGYPDGLAGDVIPLPARIIAVCAAYVAMTTDPGGRGEDEALAELQSAAGSQFDPEIVACLCRIVADEGLAADAPADPPVLV